MLAPVRNCGVRGKRERKRNFITCRLVPRSASVISERLMMLQLINTETKPSRESATFEQVINLLLSRNFLLFMHAYMYYCFVDSPSLCVERRDININNYN